MESLLFVGVAWLAFANGANDNFKGVATLYGSRALSYRAALALASVATLLGSLLSLALAAGLVRSFSGADLAPAGIAGSSAFAASVASGAALTVLLATRLGLPTSTTHALTGALLGAAFAANGAAPSWQPLLHKFLVPLLLSPVIAIALTWMLLEASKLWGPRSAASGATCVCVAECEPVRVQVNALSSSAPPATLVLGSVEHCERDLGPAAVVMRSDRIAGVAHVFSAGSVCIARAVNDTPKIAALLAATRATSGGWTLALVALAMLAGGLFASRRVAETLSHRIAALEPRQGLAANLITSGLVIAASRYGLPVSTTHVSCGSILGVGVATNSARWRAITTIVAAWGATLPLAALAGAGAYSLLISNP